MGMNMYILPKKGRLRPRLREKSRFRLRFRLSLTLASALTLSLAFFCWAEEKRVVNEEIGILVATITEEYKQDLNLNNANGVIVLGVLPGGPADEGGIHPGDVILGIADMDINNLEEYEDAINKLKGKVDFNLMVRTRDGYFSFIQIITRGD